MTRNLQRPFESIESALEFMDLLEKTIEEASTELSEQAHEAAETRSGNGIRLALYKLKQLSFHVQKSERLLNDLRLIRGVLVREHAKAAGQH